MKTPKLSPGRYLMTWAGYTVPVEILQRHDGSLSFVPPSGYAASIDTVPDATFVPAAGGAR